jgi:hypothetical protein
MPPFLFKEFFMKIKFFLLGMLATALASGFVFIGCDLNPDDDPPPPATPIPPTTPTPAAPPVEISTLAQLNAIGASAESLRKNYKLMADIGGVTTPIGNVSGGMFTGDFDGNGRTVTVNILTGSTVSGGPLAGTYAGLFASLGGTVHDLTVAGTVSITTSGSVYAGGVAAGMLPGAAIRKVASLVDVTAIGGGDVKAGGIVGGVQNAAVSNSHATGNVSATSGGGAQAGGIVGAAIQGTVSNVYATGDISATGTGDNMGVGGIMGSNDGGSVSYAYATGVISATANGTGPGDDSITVCAGGIVGGSNPGPVVRYTVALNSAVSASGTDYKKTSYRIISTPAGTVTTNGAANYGKSDLEPSRTPADNTPMDKGAGEQDGADITVTGGPLPTPYTMPGESWWRDTGFSGADWTTVWRWDPATGLPALR